MLHTALLCAAAQATSHDHQPAHSFWAALTELDMAVADSAWLQFAVRLVLHDMHGGLATLHKLSVNVWGLRAPCRVTSITKRRTQVASLLISPSLACCDGRTLQHVMLCRSTGHDVHQIQQAWPPAPTCISLASKRSWSRTACAALWQLLRYLFCAFSRSWVECSFLSTLPYRSAGCMKARLTDASSFSLASGCHTRHTSGRL